MANYQWEVNLIESNDVNANCRPGGKMIVYTGILPVTQSEDGLAVVMGHEVAHAVCHHGNERISQTILLSLGEAGIIVGMRKKDPKVTAAVAAAFGGVGALGILKYSRDHESEADHVGLILMARAGFDPREAERFWVRMKQQGGGGGPSWLSTHPSHETRIKQIQEWIPEAMQYYHPRGG